MSRLVRAVLGTALVVAGCAMLAWLVGERQAEAREVQQAQQQLADEVPAGPAIAASRQEPDRRWAPVATPVAPGQALVEMRIPRLGEDWRWTALEGTADDVLARGPGHYPGTPLPGERGNVAFAGHRAGHGDPFLDFDELRAGDEIVLSQGRVSWTYRVTAAPEVVPATADWVLDPLPGRQLTLTTCWPKWGSSKRMFVRAELTDVRS